MIRKIIPLLILSFLFGSCDIFGQKIFREGYIVKKTGETYSGIVGYSINQGIPSECTFKRFDIARPVVYTPDEISAFGYKNGNRYESKQLNNKNSFYEVIVTGKIILYTRKGNFYIDKEHAGLIELMNGVIKYPSAGKIMEFASLPEFLGYITEGKTGKISSSFDLKDDIEPLITSYNKESGSPFYIPDRTLTEKQLTRQASESGANKNRLGVLTGVNIYNLKITPTTNNFEPDPEKEAGLVYGLTYERILSRKNDRFALRLDVLYNSQTFYCFDESVGGGGYLLLRNDTFFNFTGIKGYLLGQYMFTGGRFVPYLNAGFAYNYLLSNDYYRMEESETSQHVISTMEYSNMTFNSGETTFSGGAGIRTRVFGNCNIQFQGNIEIGKGIFMSEDANSLYFKQSSFQTTFMIGLIF